MNRRSSLSGPCLFVAATALLSWAVGLRHLIVFSALSLFVFWVAARRRRRAREGSLADRSDRRFVWVVGLMPFDVVFTAFAVFGPSRTLAVAAAVAMLGSKLAFWTWDFALLRRLGRLGGEWQTMTALVTPSVAAGAVPWFDLGVGDAVRAAVTWDAGTYRDAARPIRVIVGDPERSAAVVRANLRRIAVAAAVWGYLLALFVGAKWYVMGS